MFPLPTFDDYISFALVAHYVNLKEKHLSKKLPFYIKKILACLGMLLNRTFLIFFENILQF